MLFYFNIFKLNHLPYWLLWKLSHFKCELFERLTESELLWGDQPKPYRFFFICSPLYLIIVFYIDKEGSSLSYRLAVKSQLPFRSLFIANDNREFHRWVWLKWIGQNSRFSNLFFFDMLKVCAYLQGVTHFYNLRQILWRITFCVRFMKCCKPLLCSI